MTPIYLDNAATSFPKPPEVAEAVYDFMKNIGTNINQPGRLPECLPGGKYGF